ncbi:MULTISPECIES: hypothetical protein [unclassified Mesorhizobium]|nr:MULTISPECIES: hypothetical protein [unclassified Mesorhizobium]
MLKAPPANETVTKRTITWVELYKLRPDLKPDNDNARSPRRPSARRPAGE